jgi:hypothetical protein
VDLRTCTTSEAFAAEIAKDAPRLAVVDLNARGNPLGAIEQMQAHGSKIPLIGFLSHVQVDLAERARAAGCRDVMPRSKFTHDLATIFAQVKSEAS